MDLKETTALLLRSHDIGNWLEMADNYIQMYNKKPEAFVLPAAHKRLRPVIESFAADTSAFSEYVKALRDSCDGVSYDELHALYRKVSLRALQSVRRTRMRRAVLMLNPEVSKLLGRPTTYDEQMRMADWIEMVWGKMRTDLMDAERASLATKRIPTEEREVILKAFWANLDKKMDKGEVLIGEHSINEVVERLNK